MERFQIFATTFSQVVTFQNPALTVPETGIITSNIPPWGYTANKKPQDHHSIAALCSDTRPGGLGSCAPECGPPSAAANEAAGLCVPPHGQMGCRSPGSIRCVPSDTAIRPSSREPLQRLDSSVRSPGQSPAVLKMCVGDRVRSCQGATELSSAGGGAIPALRQRERQEHRPKRRGHRSVRAHVGTWWLMSTQVSNTRDAAALPESMPPLIAYL